MELNFDRIAGQQLAKFIFRDAVIQGTIAPTYLFSGPRGVGKATYAIEVAKILNCESDRVRPCMECSSCKEIENLNFPDLWVILPDKIRGEKPGRWSRIRPDKYTPTLKISIDQVREIENEVSKPPVFGRYRVVIVLNAENLTVEAQNASLKLLEEHPSHTVFILVSANINQVLPTIVSRSRNIRFRLLTQKEFFRINFPVEDREIMTVLYRLSQGSPGLTFSFIGSAVLSMRDEILENWINNGIRGFLESTLLFTTEIADASLMLWLLSSIFNDLLLLKMGVGDTVVNIDKVQILDKLAKDLSFQQIESFLETLREVDVGLRRNQNAKALFTMLIGSLFERSYLDTFIE